VKPKINTALKLSVLLRPQSILAFTWRYWRQMNYSEFLKLIIYFCRNQDRTIRKQCRTCLLRRSNPCLL